MLVISSLRRTIFRQYRKRSRPPLESQLGYQRRQNKAQIQLETEAAR